jgi:hypothetical protein
MLNKTASEANLMNQSSCLAPALGVAKFSKHKDIIWVTNISFGLRLFNKLSSKFRKFNNLVAFSATHISTTKSLKVVVNTKIFFSSK